MFDHQTQAEGGCRGGVGRGASGRTLILVRDNGPGDEVRLQDVYLMNTYFWGNAMGGALVRRARAGHLC